jgi:signal transduction histidine kinase
VVGSGIGLAVVREIVAAHGGEAWVEDAPSGGARFVVELPALHTARAEDLDGRVASIRSSSGVA